jgi:hypothetical protein
MAAIRQVLAELIYSDDEERRTEPEQRFINLVRVIARQEADRPVQVVDELPADAPANSLWRTTNPADLGSMWLGNGPGRPLSRYIAV